jgi:uncharacterized Zn finger protein
MSRKRQRAAETGTERQSPKKYWASLSWDDLTDWAGERSVSRGRTYQRQGRVHDLAVSENGRLLASVIGGDRYAVIVWCELDWMKVGGLHSRCTCPVGANGCKHAVAVVAAYLELLGQDADVPPVDPEDQRWAMLANGDPDANAGAIDADEEEEAQGKLPSRTKGGFQQVSDEKIRKHIDAKSRKELGALVWSLTERYPELREEFWERIALGEGNVDRLVALARQELRRVTSETGWRNNWIGEGHTPDYSRLKHRLERMVELGQSDAVVRLAQEIIARGMEQIGQSDDEGETASALSECFPVIFKAVVESILPPTRKLLFAIDAHLQDEYDIIGGSSDVVLDEPFEPAAWSAVADELALRLEAGTKKGDDFQRRFHRDQISNWLIHALKESGRDDEVLAICEREARATDNYQRLVSLLIEQKQYDEAERWAAEGIEKTVNRFPGIASNLGKSMGEAARLRERWGIVAAHAAWEFFESPSREKFEQLIAASAKAGCQDAVRRFALEFLETGVSPISVVTHREEGRKGAVSTGWPLPTPDYLFPLLRTEAQSRMSDRPHYGVLIDMAVADRRYEDVLRWYDKMRADQKQTRGALPWLDSDGYADRVAEAVAKSHPDRALGIYRQCVNDNLTRARVSAYEVVAAYLRKMRPILKSLHREDEWTQTVADIRLRYRNRPRFMEILDRLDSRPILQSSGTRR